MITYQSENKLNSTALNVNNGMQGKQVKTLPAVPVLQNTPIVQKATDAEEVEPLQEKENPLQLKKKHQNRLSRYRFCRNFLKMNFIFLSDN